MRRSMKVWAWADRASSTVTVAVLLLPLVLLVVTVAVLAVASLVVPARRQRYLVAVLDRLVELAKVLRGSRHVGPQGPAPP
jgi:hypothetical protein